MQGYKVKIIFAKKGLMRFISHLDIMRLFSRALRRGKLPVKLTQGFNPHIKLSFKRALKLGIESEGEEMVLYLKQEVRDEEVKDRLQQQLPEGIELKTVCQLVG